MKRGEQRGDKGEPELRIRSSHRARPHSGHKGGSPVLEARLAQAASYRTYYSFGAGSGYSSQAVRA